MDLLKDFQRLESLTLVDSPHEDLAICFGSNNGQRLEIFRDMNDLMGLQLIDKYSTIHLVKRGGACEVDAGRRPASSWAGIRRYCETKLLEW